MTMTRRDFLSASAGLAMTPAFGARQGRAPLPREADIVVIGAGAAGLLRRGGSWRRTAR